MNDDLPDDPKRAFVLNNSRVIGAFMTMVGAFLGKATIYRPICDAHEGIIKVSGAYKRASLAVIFLLFGGLYLFGGRKAVEFLWPPPGERLKVKYILGAFGALIVLAVPELLRMYLSSFNHVF